MNVPDELKFTKYSHCCRLSHLIRAAIIWFLAETKEYFTINMTFMLQQDHPYLLNIYFSKLAIFNNNSHYNRISIHLKIEKNS